MERGSKGNMENDKKGPSKQHLSCILRASHGLMIPSWPRPNFLGNGPPRVALHINQGSSVWWQKVVQSWYRGPSKMFGIRDGLLGPGGRLLRYYSGLHNEVNPVLAHAVTSTYNFHGWSCCQIGCFWWAVQFRGT